MQDTEELVTLVTSVSFVAFVPRCLPDLTALGAEESSELISAYLLNFKQHSIVTPIIW